MNCPRCEQTLLVERDRDGIVVDGCPGCRGLWLDRGELERLIARALLEEEGLGGRPDGRERDDDERQPGRQDGHKRDDREHDFDNFRLGKDRDRDHDRDSAWPRPAGQGRRPRRWYESLTDIFD